MHSCLWRIRTLQKYGWKIVSCLLPREQRTGMLTPRTRRKNPSVVALTLSSRNDCWPLIPLPTVSTAMAKEDAIMAHRADKKRKAPAPQPSGQTQRFCVVPAAASRWLKVDVGSSGLHLKMPHATLHHSNNSNKSQGIMVSSRLALEQSTNASSVAFIGTLSRTAHRTSNITHKTRASSVSKSGKED